MAYRLGKIINYFKKPKIIDDITSDLPNDSLNRDYVYSIKHFFDRGYHLCFSEKHRNVEYVIKFNKIFIDDDVDKFIIMISLFNIPPERIVNSPTVYLSICIRESMNILRYIVESNIFQVNYKVFCAEHNDIFRGRYMKLSDIAAKFGNVNIIKYLNDIGEDVGYSIYDAILSRSIDIIDYLYDNKIVTKYNYSNEKYMRRNGSLRKYHTFLDFACKVGDIDIITRLLNKNCDPNAYTSASCDYNRAIVKYIKNFNDINVLHHFVAAGFDFNYKSDMYNESLIHISIMYNNKKFVKQLIKYGTDLNCQSKRYGSAILYAVRRFVDEKHTETHPIFKIILLLSKTNCRKLECINYCKSNAPDLLNIIKKNTSI